MPTYCVSFTEAFGDHIVHIAVFTELQLGQVHFYLAVLHKHTLFNHLQKEDDYQFTALNHDYLMLNYYAKNEGHGPNS